MKLFYNIRRKRVEHQLIEFLLEYNYSVDSIFFKRELETVSNENNVDSNEVYNNIVSYMSHE